MSENTTSSTGTDDVLIRVGNVSKRFCRDLKKSLFYGMQDIACDLLGRDRSEAGLRKDEFLANQGICFELRRGECLGLIGHNGAGKTTLLKMLNGLIKPDTGRIEMHGRVGALIALGAGFNPILTGRENVYIAGSVLGLSKDEIEAKYDEIVEFSELEEFMESPVQNYSSGMQVRLGFAVASSLEPDILLIDEVLAVGDVGFRTKCYNRINKLKESTAIIFVSHNVGHIGRLCEKCILLNHGQVDYFGDTPKAINRYNAQSPQEEAQKIVLSSGCALNSVKLNGTEFYSGIKVEGDQALRVDVAASFSRFVGKVEFVVTFFSEAMDQIASANSRFQGVEVVVGSESCCLSVEIPQLGLGSGKKAFAITIIDSEAGEILIWANPLGFVSVENKIHVPPPILLAGNFKSTKL